MANILIIEDDPALLKLYGTILSRVGYSVTLTDSGEAGIEAARHSPPDLVILDLVLPGIPGVEVARRLRQNRILPEARLIAISGMGQEFTGAMGECINATVILIKPFGVSLMLDAVEKALASPAPSALQANPGSTSNTSDFLDQANKRDVKLNE